MIYANGKQVGCAFLAGIAVGVFLTLLLVT
jgi:hypothetical protein